MSEHWWERGTPSVLGVLVNPTIQNSETNPAPVKHWRCTRGHTWNSIARIEGVRMAMADLGIESEGWCWICIRDLLREHCGHVHEVP